VNRLYENKHQIMPPKTKINYFRKQVLAWFEHSGRHDLPWQKNTTPYRVWISEIMLQQTQVSTAIPYFQKFMKSFPSVKTLAEADLNEVLAHWSGLGYYARARNLHKTAKIIQEHYKGRFPKTIEALSALPGIGRSTAGAILSLADNIPAPILDGNVKRVLARFEAVAGWPGEAEVLKRLWALSTAYTPEIDANNFNQAMMDLGATLCTRTKPQCPACPLIKHCAAHAEHEEERYPTPKATSIKPKKVVNWILLRNPEGALLLEQRPPTGIWGGLWGPPEYPLDTSANNWCEQKFACTILRSESQASFKHVFSHFELKIQPVLVDVSFKKNAVFEASSQIWLKPSDKLPGGLAAPVKKILITLGYLP